MSKELVEVILKQTEALTVDEKLFLANHLLEQIKMLESAGSATNSNQNTAQLSQERDRRNLEMKWLKEHQAEYGGRYVALYGECLLGYGSTYREALETARKTGVKHPFIVHGPDRNVEYFAGW